MKSSRRSFIEKNLLLLPGILAGIVQKSDAATWSAKLSSKKFLSEDGFKINVFSKCLQWLNIKDMAKLVSEMGYHGIDLTVRPNGHVQPEHAMKDLPEAVDTIRKTGLEVYMITTSIHNPADPVSIEILKTASTLGIKHYRMDWLYYDQAKTIKENIRCITEQMLRLAELNQKYQIAGEYQNHSGDYFGSAIWDLYEALDNIRSSWLGIQYDIYHATIEGTNSWKTGLKLVAPCIKSLAIKDFCWSEKDGRCFPEAVPLGEGMIDFREFFSLVKKYRISGPISMHFEYPLGGAESGAKTISISPDIVVENMRRDLDKLKRMLLDAGL